MPCSALWRVQLCPVVSGYAAMASGDQKNRVSVYFRDIPPKMFTRAMLTIAIFAQPDRAVVLNQGREGSPLVSHKGLLMGTKSPERDFRCRALIFMRHE